MMTLSKRLESVFLSFDYLDFDVYLNTQLFYRLAGYNISIGHDLSMCDLVVLLRGVPPHPFFDYSGIVHVYDYVKELSIDYTQFFPSARVIYLISFDSLFSSPSPIDKLVHITGYLPVFPDIWSYPRRRKTCSHPLHIGNFKPINDDLFQNQLTDLSFLGLIKIFGAKWDKVGITSHSLSYYQANRLLSQAYYCLGLMYPYQRGRSLSGRMWQAPINACYVISEPGTNIFDCPGVIEANDYLTVVKNLPPYSPLLAQEACSFWRLKTIKLANDLNLELNIRNLETEVRYAKFLLYKQHLLFLYNVYVNKPSSFVYAKLRASLGLWLKRISNSILQ